MSKNACENTSIGINSWRRYFQNFAIKNYRSYDKNLKEGITFSYLLVKFTYILRHKEYNIYLLFYINTQQIFKERPFKIPFFTSF